MLDGQNSMLNDWRPTGKVSLNVILHIARGED